MKERSWVILLIVSVVLIVMGIVFAFYIEEEVVRVVPVPTRATTFPYRVLGSVIGVTGGVTLVISVYHFLSKRGKEKND